MDVGDYLSTRVSVPEGTGSTAAAYSIVHPDGTTSSGTGSTADGGLTFSATVLLAAAGWGRTTWTVTGPGAGVQHSRWFVAAAPTAWGVWPPSIADLRLDMQRDGQVDVSDQALEQVLSAAIDYVQDVKRGRINFGTGEESESELADPEYRYILGTLRYAERLHQRRMSPDGLLNMGEMGSARVGSGDLDVDRLLRIGRFGPATFA